MPRRPLLAIALLAATLHGVGIARSALPAQDGLKFLRVARDFPRKPWADVVRSSDQHPLYPAVVALAQPIVATIAGDGAESWRIAAQVVSALASLATLIPLYWLTRSLFDSAKATMACLLFVLLPLPAELGHETLSDSLALFLFASTMAFGVRVGKAPTPFHSSHLDCTSVVLNRVPVVVPDQCPRNVTGEHWSGTTNGTQRTHSRETGWARVAITTGFLSGLGYLTRPELAIAPIAIVLTLLIQSLRGWSRTLELRRTHFSQMATISVGFLFLVGSYALVKGEVSEKLALRRSIAVGSTHDQAARTIRPLPAGLDDPRWDFSAKEESAAPGSIGLSKATILLFSKWCESLGVLLVPLAFFGMWRARYRPFGLLMPIYGCVFSLILIRHAATFGYLSSRHVLSLMLVSLPFAASAILDLVRAVRVWREKRSPGSVDRMRFVRILAVGAMIAFGLGVQFHRPPHQTRWGHNQAGLWLKENANEASTVLDTRGWANFVSGRPGHDYWHVRQALTDPHLGYIVVGSDELSASSKRAETLRAVLAYAGELAVTFPERQGGRSLDVQVYRFHPPDNWKGMTP